jgi:hypothetical protein
VSFVAAMTVVIGLLALTGSGGAGGSGGFLIATNVETFGAGPEVDPIFRTDAAPDDERWTGIVIHDLGRPAGDADFVHRLHLSYGYQGLGYHFLVGNGNGLGDGIVHVGYRWNQQLPGAHVARAAADSVRLNEHTIGICLIGNGDRRPFTAKQMRSLVSLVRRLQEELGIPAERVVLHRDLVPDLSSPGRFFAVAQLEEQLVE